MADDTHQNRTEAATPRRREDARKKGMVAASADLSAALRLLAGVGLMWLGGSLFGQQIMAVMRASLLYRGPADWSTDETAQLAGIVFQNFLHAAGPILGGLFVATLAIGALQAGVRVTFQPLVPNWDRISPAKGWSRLMSSRGVMRGVSTTLKGGAVAAVAYYVFQSRIGEITRANHDTLSEAVREGWQLTLLLALAAAGPILLVGIVDYLYQRWRHEQDLRMTRQELVDERREEEGDPMIRARLRKLQREMRERRSIQEVPKASVVITNPTHFAVALRYDRATMAAPKVIAKGADDIAHRIVHVARQHGVRVVENKPLARALFAAVEVGHEIPVEFYYAVAEILAYVNRLNRAA